MFTITALTFDQLKSLAGSHSDRYHVLDANGDVILAVAFNQHDTTVFTFSFSTPIAVGSDSWFATSTQVANAG